MEDLSLLDWLIILLVILVPVIWGLVESLVKGEKKTVEIKKENGEIERKEYFMMGFWPFAITATFILLLFPWSILLLYIFMDKGHFMALMFSFTIDLVSTFIAIIKLIGIIALISFAVYLFFIFS